MPNPVMMYAVLILRG